MYEDGAVTKLEAVDIVRALGEEKDDADGDDDVFDDDDDDDDNDVKLPSLIVPLSSLEDLLQRGEVPEGKATKRERSKTVEVIEPLLRAIRKKIGKKARRSGTSGFSFIKSVFDEADTDGSGDITVDELGDVLKQVGATLTSDEEADIFDIVDVDGTGTIGVVEFCRLLFDDDDQKNKKIYTRKLFSKAKARVEELQKEKEVGEANAVLLYAYGQQATEGKLDKAANPKPEYSFFNSTSSARAQKEWESWRKLGDMSQVEARMLYITTLGNMDEKWAKKNVKTGGNGGKGKSGRGSDKENDDDDDDDDDDDSSDDDDDDDDDVKSKSNRGKKGKRGHKDSLDDDSEFEDEEDEGEGEIVGTPRSTADLENSDEVLVRPRAGKKSWAGIKDKRTRKPLVWRKGIVSDWDKRKKVGAFPSSRVS